MGQGHPEGEVGQVGGGEVGEGRGNKGGHGMVIGNSTLLHTSVFDTDTIELHHN